LETSESIKNDPIDFEVCENEISSTALDLLKKLLDKNPSQRISINEALHHEWFSNFEAPLIIKLPEHKQKLNTNFESQIDM